MLDGLDGSYLHCEKRLSDAGPFDLIWFEDAKREAVANYLLGADAKPYIPALERATTVIDGFESFLGMELLATVDWLLFEGKVERTVAALRSALKDWPGGGKTAATRKLKLFDDRLLGLALARLALKHRRNCNPAILLTLRELRWPQGRAAGLFAIPRENFWHDAWKWFMHVQRPSASSGRTGLPWSRCPANGR